MREASIKLAAKIRDWLSSPHGPDEDLDQQLAEMIEEEFHAVCKEKEGLRVEYEIRRDWIAKMNKILGYDNSDGFHNEPDPFTIAENMVKDCEVMDRRLAQCEYAVELLTWFQSNRYAHLIHRHDGSFRAVDESLNVSWETDRLELLADLIKDNPVTERAP